MVVSRLFTKVLAQPITTQKMIAGLQVPNKAAAFDYVSGVGKKGKFQIYTFKDAKGRPVQRNMTFFNNGEVTKQNRLYWREQGAYNISDVKINSAGECVSSKLTAMHPFANPLNQRDVKLLQYSEQSGSVDSFSYSMLSRGKSKTGIKFDSKWDGKKPDIAYVNVEDKFTAKNQDYLPLLLSRMDSNTDKRVGLIQAIQERIYGLKGMCTPVRRVPLKDLNGGIDIAPDAYCTKAVCGYDGSIKIADSITDSTSLLEFLGHEFKHASDFSKVYRVKNPEETPELLEQTFTMFENLGFTNIRKFHKESIAKGQFEPDSNIGKSCRKVAKSLEKAIGDSNYSSREVHDTYLFEKRANAAGSKEVQKLNDLSVDLFNYLLKQVNK